VVALFGNVHRLHPVGFRPALNPTAAVSRHEPSRPCLVVPGHALDRGRQFEALRVQSKRTGDLVVVAGGALGWASPLFLLLAILVKFSSPGRWFLRPAAGRAQLQRVRLHQIPNPGVPDADRFLHALLSKSPDFPPSSRKTSNSGRSAHSRHGRFPAPLHLDELPQFLNVPGTNECGRA